MSDLYARLGAALATTDTKNTRQEPVDESPAQWSPELQRQHLEFLKFEYYGRERRERLLAGISTEDRIRLEARCKAVLDGECTAPITEDEKRLITARDAAGLDLAESTQHADEAYVAWGRGLQERLALEHIDRCIDEQPAPSLRTEGGKPRLELRRALEIRNEADILAALRTLDPRPDPLQSPEWDGWRSIALTLNKAIQEASQIIFPSLAMIADLQLLRDECAGVAVLHDSFVQHKEAKLDAWRWTRKHARQRRLESFVPLCLALRENAPRFWTWKRCASLVLQAGDDWDRHPCPETVKLINEEEQNLVDMLRADARELRKAGQIPLV